MYRLLIVSKAAHIEGIFTSIDAWEQMGYKQPRIRTSVEDAIACMHKHHIDAIAIDDDADFEPLYAYLDENAPDMPIFALANDAQGQLAIIRQLDQLLGYLHSDHSDDDYDEGYYMGQARASWMHKLLKGKVEDENELKQQHRLLRMREKPDAPCVYATLSVPQGDQFLSGRWHYGSARLETALRNFFGNEYGHMSVRLSVATPAEVRVAFCPLIGVEPQISEKAVEEYIRETIEQVDNYLGLTMALESVMRVDGLIAFTKEKGFSEA